MGIRKTFFSFLYENIYCGYSLEAPQRGALSECHSIRFCEEIREISTIFGKKVPYLEL